MATIDAVKWLPREGDVNPDRVIDIIKCYKIEYERINNADHRGLTACQLGVALLGYLDGQEWQDPTHLKIIGESKEKAT